MLRVRPITLLMTIALMAVPAGARAAGPALPPEVQNVRLAGSTVSWDAAPRAVAYRAYRALVSDLPNYCAAGTALTVATAFDDFEAPPVGGAFTYLAAPVNSAGLGSLGVTSAGAARSLTARCDLDLDGIPDDQDNCPDDANPGQEDFDLDDQGDACQFAASGVALRARVPLDRFPVNITLSRANDVWGYVSPAGEEYAIVGFRTGTAFVRVTDPAAPGLAGFIDGAGVNQPWRDMAVFGQHAYIVSDGAGVGLQIADLTGIDNDLVTLAATSTLGAGFQRAHNVFVNAASGTLYLAIPNINSGLGITAFDLNVDPANPAFAGAWIDTDPGVRCHDFYVLTYPSGPFAGREIAYCFAENDGLRIVDVTDKAGMVRLAKLVYPTTRYTHQGWLTEDRRYVLIGDELDERDHPSITTTTTYVVDVLNPAAPTLVTTFTNGLPAIDHNLMVRGEFVYEANYTSGLRVFSLCNINNAREVGFLDTHPGTNATEFKGAWGVYSRLPSGTILVSDIERGLFVLDASQAVEGTNDKCSVFVPHDPVCDPCIAQICAQRPSCCSAAWTSQCVEDARTVCGSLACLESAGSCAHTLCSEGAALSPFCDTPPAPASCVDTICLARPACCALAWDAACVGLVATACGLNCD